MVGLAPSSQEVTVDLSRDSVPAAGCFPRRTGDLSLFLEKRSQCAVRGLETHVGSFQSHAQAVSVATELLIEHNHP